MEEQAGAFLSKTKIKCDKRESGNKNGRKTREMKKKHTEKANKNRKRETF